MLKKLIPLFTILIIYLVSCNQIYEKYKQKEQTKLIQETNKILLETETTPSNNTNNIEIKYIPNVDTSIGSLKIQKINLYNKLYPLNSNLNNIEKNVTILNYSNEPSENNSIIFIAAHSGSGKLAYFKNLNKLEINDIIELTFKNKQYTYIIKDIWQVTKTGNITVEKEINNQLVLTTCSPNNKDKQLIINSILIKKES